MTINLLLAQAGSNIIREWYMITSMGSQMREYEAATGTKIEVPLIWMGGGHAESLATKFASLDIPLIVVESEYNKEHRISDGSFGKMVAAVAIDGIVRLR